MVLSGLLEKLNYNLIKGDANIEINNLVYDSRKVAKGDVFVCIKGAVSDGHIYAKQVAIQKAAAIIIQDDIELTEDFDNTTIIKVEDTRLALALMSAAFFGYPAKELFTIGITGTKGKTTTTYMVRDILEKCGIKTGLIGTIQTIIDDEVIPSANTTPESYKVQEYFRKMVDKGLKCVVMEVSSQALMMHRTAGILFDVGVFTNLEPDHIGPNEHASFEDYAYCKSLLFKQCKTGIFNIDSPHYDEMLKEHTCSVVTYGIGNNADYRAANIEYIHNGGDIFTNFSLSGRHNMDIRLSLPGEFSVYNALCAIAVCMQLDINDEGLLEALFKARVPGRIEPVKVSDDYIVMIDYAHNAMALKSLLSTIREYQPERIVTVFGCGGNRSRDRRFEMGQVSGELSDLTIITSDNPRNEEPVLIMKDIEVGINRTNGEYVMVENRGDAVKYAIANAKKGDVILVVGKGHEDYQEIKGVKYHMTDRELIENAAKELA